jgi:type II secretory pathway component GspD/PulD (secretin)
MTGKLSDSSYLSPCKAGLIVFVLAVLVLLTGSYPLAAEENGDSKLLRYRVFSLRHIPAQKGKEYLAQAKIGTVSQLPGANMLLVTASPMELTKASVIMSVVDAGEEFGIREIFPASSSQDLPSNEQIAAEVGHMPIGTFSELPAGAGEAKAIIDVHNDAVIVVAPVGRLEEIVSAIENLRNRKLGTVNRESYPVEVEEEPNFAEVSQNKKPATNNEQQPTANKQRDANDVFFNKLFNSLAEAEKIAAGQAQKVSAPNEPNAVAVVPEPNEPNAVATAREVEVPSEPSAEQPKEAYLAAILKRLEAIEAKLEAAPQAEEVAVEIEEPNEVKVGQPNEVEIEEANEVVEPVPKVGPYEPVPIANGEDVLMLDLPAKLTLDEFLGFMGEHLQLNYLYDPTKVKGNVNLMLKGKFRGPIKVKDLYPLLAQVLEFNGFVMARKDNLVTIVPIAEADRIYAPIVRTDKDELEYGDVIVTRIFKLKHVDTTSAKNLLTTMQLSLKDKIREIPETGTLIVTGYAYRMPRIEEVLEMIDKPGEPKQFRFRQLKYTMAKTLAPKIEKLVGQLGGISITIGKSASPSALKRKQGESMAAFKRREAQAKRAAARREVAPKKGKAEKPGVYLDFDERTNRVMMIGLESELDVVEELIDALDVEQQDLRTLRLYDIQNVDAEEVRKKLEELGMIGRAKTSTRTRKPTTTRPPAKAGSRPPPAATTSSKTEEALVEEPQVIIIESTNSLLVNATAEQHAQIALIIGYVDSVTRDISVPYVVYPLENQDPLELSDVLNQLVRETVTGKDAKGAKITTTTKRIEEDIIIIADPKTYSLIVYASKKNQQWISSLIKQLDEYRPQVLLDVSLVEVTKNDEFSYDLNLISSFPDLVSTSGLTGLISGEGADAITSSKIMEKLNGMDRFIDLQSNKGSGTAFYGDRHINVLLTAMQTKDYGRVLARPKLLVNDNEQGSIKAQETTYITRTKVSYRQGPVGEEDIPVIDTTFEPYEAGIQLDIEPHISKGDQLRLTITITRTDFRDTAASLRTVDPTPPDKVTSDVTTVITVPDNTTIILGGLERLTQSKGGTKVPLLGDIPIVGGLFRSTANTDAQSRLYVFVKAHILRPGEEITGESDIEIVSAKNRAKFERYEKEMQEYEDWPGIKPKPMDPLRILEAD